MAALQPVLSSGSGARLSYPGEDDIVRYSDIYGRSE